MTEGEWRDLLKTYTTTRQVIEETHTGIVNHLGMKCNRRQTMTVVTPSAGKRGLPPFHQELMVCDRGTQGCNLVHNDRQALVFMQMALERALELESGDEPMPDIDPITTGGR